MTVSHAGRQRLKAFIGPRLTVLARCVLRGQPLPRWGNLRRVQPFSKAYGSDRGTPVDRYYLDRFLDANRSAITGRSAGAVVYETIRQRRARITHG